MSESVSPALPRSVASSWRRIGWTVLNAAQAGFTLVWTGGCIVAALLLRALTGSRRRPLRMASRLWAPGLLGGAGARLEIDGADAIDWQRPYVLIANHQSMIDICALFRAVPVPLRFVLKQELAAVPLLGWYARAMGMVFVDRGTARRARERMLAAAGMVRDGATVVAFAEGTRSRDGSVGAFKGGAFQLAIEAGVPVLPVAIAGSGAVLPARGFAVRPGRIRLRFGTPIDSTGLDRHRLADASRAQVVSLLETAAR